MTTPLAAVGEVVLLPTHLLFYSLSAIAIFSLMNKRDNSEVGDECDLSHLSKEEKRRKRVAAKSKNARVRSKSRIKLMEEELKATQAKLLRDQLEEQGIALAKLQDEIIALQDEKIALQDQLAEQIIASNQDLSFQRDGYILIPPAVDKGNVDSLKEAVENSLGTRSSKISGDYTQTNLRDLHTLLETSMMLQVLGVAKRIFSRSLGHEVEVRIHQAAVLESPPMSNESNRQALHADNIGFVSLGCIIMLSKNGGDSTCIISSKYHGVESTISRSEFLGFTYHRRSQYPAVRTAVADRYGPLLVKKPLDLYGLCQPTRLEYGEIEIFRSDILHAGPVTNMQRKVLFLDLRVIGEVGPNDSNYQFKIPHVMTIARCNQENIKQAKIDWKVYN